MDFSRTEVLVIGCGGIGGIVAAHLRELGVDAVVVSRAPAVAEAINRRGFRLEGAGGQRTVPGQVVERIPAGRSFDYVLLATQPNDVEDAARAAWPHLAADGRMVCFQNGLCEERVAAIVDQPDRVLGAVIAWGASTSAPGVYDRTSSGGFTLGRLDGTDDPRIAPLALMLESIGPVQLTSNLTGARWSKLALNCAITPLGAISGERLGWMVQRRWIRRLALELITEAVAVAGQLDVKLEKIAGTLDLDWMALSAPEQRLQLGSLALASKHAMLLAVGLRYRRLRSSMLRAIEHGREPAIAFLNGEVVARAAALGVPVPVNEAVCEQVRRIARGELSPGEQPLEALFERTRAPLAG